MSGLENRSRALATFIDYVRAANDEAVQLADVIKILTGVLQLVQHLAHRIQACALLAITFDHGPRRVGSVGFEKHRFLGARVVFPFV